MKNGNVLRLAASMILFGSASFAQMPGGMGGGMGSGDFMGYQGRDMESDLIIPQVVVGQHYSTSLLLLNMGNPRVMTWVSPQSQGHHMLQPSRSWWAPAPQHWEGEGWLQ